MNKHPEDPLRPLLAAARHPVIRGMATLFAFLGPLSLVLAVVGLVVKLSEPLPVADKVLWMFFLGGSGLCIFFVFWYLSRIGFAVAELGQPAIHPGSGSREIIPKP